RSRAATAARRSSPGCATRTAPSRRGPAPRPPCSREGPLPVGGAPVIRRHGTGLRALLMAVDGAVALAVLITGYWFHYGDTTPPRSEGALSSAWAPLLLYAVTWILLLYLVGEYRLRARWTLRSEIVSIGRATAWLALLGFAALFLTDLTDISRLFLLV